MSTITVCATKGGVGKTTVTANLGGYLADHGAKVLIIDADVQPTLSSYYGLNGPPASHGLTHLIQCLSRPHPSDSVRQHRRGYQSYRHQRIGPYLLR